MLQQIHIQCRRIDLPIPDIPSPLLAADAYHKSSEDEERDHQQNVQLFKSNHVHKMHYRIKTLFISSLSIASTSSKAKFSPDLAMPNRSKQSITLLEKKIEKEIKKVKQEHRRNRDDDNDYGSESLGDEDSESAEEEDFEFDG